MLYFHAVRGADAGAKLITHAARFGRGKIFQNRSAYVRCAARLTSLVVAHACHRPLMASVST